MPTYSRKLFFDRAAFTLIELLTVIGIIGLLAYLTVPVVGSLFQAQAINQGIYNVSSILQLARSEAVTRQTYAWVGFLQASQPNGNEEVIALATYSLDGTTNTSPDNLYNLSPPVRMKGVVLTQWSGLKASTQQVFTANLPVGITPVSVVGSNTTALPLSTSFGFTNTITFTPRGEAMLNQAPGPDTSFDSYIDVSFQQPNKLNDASIVVEGGTGTIQTIRTP